MRRRRSNSVMSLSGAAVDLLSCGLAAAAILWILILPNSGDTGAGTVDRVSGMVRFSQFGIAHIHDANVAHIKVVFPDDSHEEFGIKTSGGVRLNPKTAPARAPKSSFSIPVPPVLVRDADGEVILKVARPNDDFAGEVVIVFREVPVGTLVSYKFASCLAKDEPHAISMLSVDRRGATSELLFWQEHSGLTKALDPSKTVNKAWFNNLVTKIAATPDKFVDGAAPLTRMFTWTNAGPNGDSSLTVEVSATETGLVRTSIVDPLESGGARFLVESKRVALIDRLKGWCSKYRGGLCGAP